MTVDGNTYNGHDGHIVAAALAALFLGEALGTDHIGFSVAYTVDGFDTLGYLLELYTFL